LPPKSKVNIEDIEKEFVELGAKYLIF